MNPRGVLCVIAKAPELGRVKTRLGEGIGQSRAMALARAFLEDTWQLGAAVPGLDAVLVLDGAAPEWLSSVTPTPPVWAQGEGDLGARMERAFTRALHHYAFAIAVGSDAPHLGQERIAQATTLLGSGASDAVIVPARDGGYALIGLRLCPSGLFEDLPWSKPHTRRATVARLRARGVSVTELEPSFDIDDVTDLRDLEAGLRVGRLHAPATARALGIVPQRPSLSVVMPVLNERARIAARLDELTQIPDIHEVIVVDGGSEDGTLDAVRDHPSAALGLTQALRADRGRARQMNAGAKACRGDTLLFLHADVSLPTDAAHHVHSALKQPGVVAGAFRTWTVDDARGTWAPWLHLADLRSRLARVPYGDQALFLPAAEFAAVGGFPDQPLMEDVEIGRRLLARGRIWIVPRSLRVSGRRFLKHPVRDTAIVNLYPLLYRAGVSPETLARWYRNTR